MWNSGDLREVAVSIDVFKRNSRALAASHYSRVSGRAGAATGSGAVCSAQSRRLFVRICGMAAMEDAPPPPRPSHSFTLGKSTFEVLWV